MKIAGETGLYPERFTAAKTKGAVAEKAEPGGRGFFPLHLLGVKRNLCY